MRVFPVFLFIFCGSFLLYAHGTEYELLSGGVIGIRALFDSGEVMADSRVLVFSPGADTSSYETTTDPNGVVCFAPDEPGVWILQVRHTGGHGLRVNLNVDESMMISTVSTTRLGLWQKILLAVCVIWGFAGTALFFLGRSKAKDSD